jgi:hypothetical protein
MAEPIIDLFEQIQQYARAANCALLDVIAQLLGIMVENRSDRADAVDDVNRQLERFRLELFDLDDDVEDDDGDEAA